MNKSIHIGTSGWSYKHWISGFYPPGLPTTEWLSYYAAFFETTEINTSFYHLPKPATVKGWMDKVPRHFRFCPKMSRFVTHIKRLTDPEEPLERFFELFEPMRKMMGPVLVQLPPNLKFDYERAEHFYRVLKNNYRQYSFAMEVRHSTWLAEDSLTLMAKYNIAFVISQSGNVFPYAEAVTAKHIYVRFHGPAQLYASPYSDEMLLAFATKFKNWVRDGHRVWAFFNNDVNGYALNDAQKLMEMMEKK